MKAKRDFSSQKKSSNSRQRTDPQNQPGSTNSVSVNVDNLVSSFLAELSDLSSGVSKGIDSAGAGNKVPGADDFKIPPNFKLQEGSKTDVDLEEIDDEIAKSLKELEDLRSAEEGTRNPQADAIKAEPEAEEKSAIGGSSVRSGDSGEAASIPLELFRNAIAFSGAKPRRTGLWIIVILALAGILCFWGYHLLRSTESSSINSTPASVSRQDELTNPRESQTAPAEAKSSSTNTEQKKNSRPEHSASTPVQEYTRTLPAANSESGKRESAKNKKAVEPADKPTSRESENRNASSSSGSGDAAAKPAAPQDSHQGAAQAPLPVISERPSSAAVTSIPATQPKTSPAEPVKPKDLPVAAAAPANDGSPVVQANASPVNSQQSNTAVQLNSRTPVSAVILTRVAPEYPTIAKRQKVSGTVELEVQVDAQGKVVSSKAVSGPILLRGAAEQALMKWKFKPASVGGVNIPSKAKISMDFTLQ